MGVGLIGPQETLPLAAILTDDSVNWCIGRMATWKNIFVLLFLLLFIFMISPDLTYC